MQILIIRHAIAEERSAFDATGKSDDHRPLTDEGRRKMTEAAKGLRALVPDLDVIAASPLVRAQQTAAIVAKAYRIADVETTSTLTPDARPAAFAKWAQAHIDHDVVAVVGHEPHLGTLVTWLLSGLADSHVVLKKGGACLVEFDGAPGPAMGHLHWLHTPAALRRMGE
jgi:phosphohistidine phosphatase